MTEHIKEKLSDLKEQHRQFYKNTGASFGIKGASILVSMINISLFMRYFEDFTVLGLWFTLLSLFQWMLNFDLKTGTGFQNHLATAFKKTDQGELQNFISSAYFSIGTITLILLALTIPLVHSVDWNRFCNVPVIRVSSYILEKSIRILLVGVLLQFLLKSVINIFYSIEKPRVPDFLMLVSDALLLLSMLFLKSGNIETNLLRLSRVYIFAENVPLLVATIILFNTKLKGIHLRFRYWTPMHTKLILKWKFHLLLPHLLTIGAFNMREFYIMRFLDPAMVVSHQIYNTIFSVLSSFFLIAITPFISSISDDSSFENAVKNVKLYKKTKILFYLFSFGNFLVIFIVPFIVRIWLGSEAAIEIDLGYSIIFVLYYMEYMWIVLHHRFEDGFRMPKNIKIGYICAIILLPFIFFATKLAGSNWIFAVLANFFALFPLCLIHYFHWLDNSAELFT